jgi:hypothetical protein
LISSCQFFCIINMRADLSSLLFQNAQPESDFTERPMPEPDTARGK